MYVQSILCLQLQLTEEQGAYPWWSSRHVKKIFWMQLRVTYAKTCRVKVVFKIQIQDDQSELSKQVVGRELTLDEDGAQNLARSSWVAECLMPLEKVCLQQDGPSGKHCTGFHSNMDSSWESNCHVEPTLVKFWNGAFKSFLCTKRCCLPHANLPSLSQLSQDHNTLQIMSLVNDC